MKPPCINWSDVQPKGWELEVRKAAMSKVDPGFDTSDLATRNEGTAIVRLLCHGQETVFISASPNSNAGVMGYSLRARHNLGLPRSGQLERELKALPASARKTAPVVVFNDQACAVPEAADVTCKSLVRERLEATLDPHGTVFAQ